MDHFHALSKDEALNIVGSSLDGLSKDQFEKRLQEFGKNTLEEEKVSYFKIFIRQLKSPIIYVLLFASVVSLVVGDLKDFSVILLVIIVNTAIGFWQEIKAEVSTLALRKMTETKVTVLRDHKKIEIPSSDLVPGDIVYFREGDVVGADIRLLSSVMLRVNEAAITGESLPVEKNAEEVLDKDSQIYELDNSLLSGTLIVKGSGVGVVVKTGKDTYLATIAQKALEKSPDSPLVKALARFSKKYMILIFIFLGMIGLVMMFQGNSVVQILYGLLAILVSAIPEGLPIVLTLALAIGSMKLARKKVLTRYLPAVETLGSTTLIACDKTGTITKGVLTVSDYFSSDLEKLKVIASVANESEDGKSGDPLDVALADWVGKNYKEIRQKHKILEVFPFDGTYKYMAASVKNGKENLTFIKGAFDTLIKNSSNSKKEIEEFSKRHDELAGEGLRIIAFGQTEDTGKFSTWKIKIIGIIGFIDPAKDGVREAVESARSAGVRIIMITGDNPLTAAAIARNVSILREGDGVLTGKEIEKLSDKDLFEKLQSVSVLARIIPEHKYRIVKLLQKNNVVAMTGDGVNDVMALKAADLGIAMGSGTQAAKSTAKMILVDDGLNVIVDAIRQGRIIADNIRKVIYYLVTTNLSQIFLIFSSIILSFPFPLKPIHILWINLVTDGVQDKAFPFIKEEGHVMKRHPHSIKNMFFDKFQMANIIFGALAIGIPNLILYIYMTKNFSFLETSTSVFTSMVIAQWINGIQAQKQIEPFFKNIKRSININPSIWLGVGAGVVLQSSVIFLLNDWFETSKLSLVHLQLILITSLVVFLIIELKKWVLYMFFNKN